MSEARTIIHQHNRLSSGGLMDRTSPLSFEFDGKTFQGFVGDTLASALLANNVKLVGRSFKYHRPRGIFTAGSEEPNALVELRRGTWREPNTKATTIPLYEGLTAQSQNRWPSLELDLASINGLLAPFLVAGFYYKTFMWPAAFWERVYEPLIRRAAGLGRASDAPDPDTYEKAHAFCDVLVIGGGPAGLSAALAAGRAGARVILCDEDFLLGGRSNSERQTIDDAPCPVWSAETTRELTGMANVQLMASTTVFGVYDGGMFGALERVSDHLSTPHPGIPRHRLWKICAKRSVLATGAIERPMVVGGNDRPGVMMASAVRTYINRHAVAPGRRLVVFTTTDDGWKTAFDAVAAGLADPIIIDARPEVDPALRAKARHRGIRRQCGARIVATRGSLSLEQITVRDRDGVDTRLQADVLALSDGWQPTLALSTHLGGRPKWSDSLAAFVPGDLPPGMEVAGAAAGSFGLAKCLRDGERAGAAAAASLGFRTLESARPRAGGEPLACNPIWFVRESRTKAFVDFQNDVTVEDVKLARREGFHAPEHLKRYTTLGMATDQGKTSTLNGLAIMASLLSEPMSRLEAPAPRPPYTPVSIGAFAGAHRGKHFRPIRQTATHAWAQAQGAEFVDAGQWARARWFKRPGENDWLTTVCREVTAVRNAVGVCDVSTLGKIDVRGPDAGAFLDLVYANTISSLRVGKVRYGVMLRDDGFVFDDGTVARLGLDYFLVSTTTVNAANVYKHLEFVRQVLSPGMDVQLASVTEQWTQLAIAGPSARQALMAMLGDAIEITNSTFPHMSCAAFQWRGVNARLFRVSFSGELGFELTVPAGVGDAVIKAVMDAGRQFGITPYGVEALGVMRVEKGHVGGAEMNGTTTLGDLGLERLSHRKESNFVGKALSQRPGLVDQARPGLVGFEPCNARDRLRAGAHVLPEGAPATLDNDQGYLTSVAFSPSLDRWIGLGLLSGGLDHTGEIVVVHDPLRGGDVMARVCHPAFIDPEGARLRA